MENTVFELTIDRIDNPFYYFIPNVSTYLLDIYNNGDGERVEYYLYLSDKYKLYMNNELFIQGNSSFDLRIMNFNNSRVLYAKNLDYNQIQIAGNYMANAENLNLKINDTIKLTVEETPPPITEKEKTCIVRFDENNACMVTLKDEEYTLKKLGGD